MFKIFSGGPETIEPVNIDEIAQELYDDSQVILLFKVIPPDDDPILSVHNKLRSILGKTAVTGFQIKLSPIVDEHTSAYPIAVWVELTPRRHQLPAPDNHE